MKSKGFKNYIFANGGKKVSDKGDLKPFKCKNLVGRDKDIFFAQTNKGPEMASKLLLREMRADIKESRAHIKSVKEGVESIKKTLNKGHEKK